MVTATDPAHGTVVVNADNTITYTPDLNWTGTDTYTYEITDNNGGFDTATVTIDVTPVNDPPVANDDLAVTDEDTPVTVPVLADDNDVDGPLDPTSVTVTAAPSDGTTTRQPRRHGHLHPQPRVLGHRQLRLPGVRPRPHPPLRHRHRASNRQLGQRPTPSRRRHRHHPRGHPSHHPVLVNDTDPDSDPIDVVTATDPAHGTVVVNADNTITYTPDLNWTGTDTYTYEITDNNGGFDTATVTIDVTPVNDPPVANDDLYSTSEDTPLTVPLPGLLGNDTDPENDTLTVTLNTQPANGTVTVNPDGSFTYTPNLNWTGTDTYTYRVCDDGSPVACDQGNVSIVVIPADDPPLAGDDVDATDEDTPVTVTVLGNDTDPDGDPLIVTSATDPANGTVVVNGDNTITYTPDLNWTGIDTFDYSISDGNGGTDTATVTITVAAVGDRPTAADDTATTDEDTAIVIPEADLLANDTDPDGDPLTITSVTDSANGTVVLGVGGDVTYTPDPGFNGIDTFTYQVCDPGNACDTATVTVTVNPQNDPPVAIDDTATTFEDTPVDVSVLVNDSDPDGDPLTVTQILTDPTNGTAVINGDNTITYTPNPNFSGTDAFEYRITDGNGGFASAWVSFILVNPINDNPVAVDDASSTQQGSSVVISVLSNDNDLDGDSLSVQSVVQPANGTTAINPGGTISYTPNAGFTGIDTFTYTISDGNGGTATATVTITVTPVTPPRR